MTDNTTSSSKTSETSGPPASDHGIWRRHGQRLIVLVGLLLIVGVVSSGPVADAARDAGLLPKQAEFTELYFENHTSLPTVVKAGDRIDFSFTIGNREGSETKYQWAVTTVGGDTPTSNVAAGETLVEDDRLVTIPVSFESPDDVDQVVVTLPALGQSIHFSVNR
jgi:hypothetical protein